MATVIGENEQRIEERSNYSCKWTMDREEEQHQLLLRMYKGQKKGDENVQRLKKRRSRSYSKWTKDKGEELFVQTRGTMVVTNENEQRTEKRGNNMCCKWTKDRKEELFV